ncbi:MAG: HAMP domain-containing histidine kinase [Candidatus Riflebacteria bacterium]|nr:HAMP domain-containing histidine kinase [Candidatus Riflebacteria bacterium]
MRLKLKITLIVLVLIPLGIFSWFGFRAADHEYDNFRITVQNLIKSKMTELDNQILKILDKRRLMLQKLTERESWTTDESHQILSSNPFVNNLFAQASSGNLIFPFPVKPLRDSERKFLIRTQSIFDQKILIDIRPENEYGRVNPPAHEDAWYTWFWDNDIRMLYWRKTSDGGVIGAELSMVRLISDIIAELPDSTTDDPLLSSGSMILADSQNRPLYRWGFSTKDSELFFSIPLSAPLRSWSLQFHTGKDFFSRSFVSGTHFQIFSAFIVLAFALFGLAYYLHFEYNRTFQEAEQRVSFVNQVSHELKTPLTNIRMYSELLEMSLPEDDEENRQKVEIIILESRRLSRMIGNVLTFSRHQKGKIQLKPVSGIPDKKIEQVLESFMLALRSKQIEVISDFNASSEFFYDSDILEQILYNLISNVEKYAWTGRKIFIKSRMENNLLNIWVRDFGRGIQEQHCSLIFQPFVRLSDRTDEGTSGTGIGLSIARDLARMHGGDVYLLYNNGKKYDVSPVDGSADIEIDAENQAGACFLARIRACDCSNGSSATIM